MKSGISGIDFLNTGDFEENTDIVLYIDLTVSVDITLSDGIPAGVFICLLIIALGFRDVDDGHRSVAVDVTVFQDYRNLGR